LGACITDAQKAPSWRGPPSLEYHGKPLPVFLKMAAQMPRGNKEINQAPPKN